MGNIRSSTITPPRADKGPTMKLKMGVLIPLLLAGTNAMACYTVYDPNSRVLYRGAEAPVDMSLPLRDALAGRYPAGASLVFAQGVQCVPVGLTQVPRPTGGNVPVNTIRMERTGRQVSPVSTAPLLTDRQTAQRQGLPYTVMAGEIVMVPAHVAARMDMPTYTVIPIAMPVARAAPPATATMGAGPARPQTVITEFHEPPMIVIERTQLVPPRRD
jgi:hypothetical protein